MEGLPSYDLELKAADERERLHAKVTELRSCLDETLDIRKNAHEYLGTVCAIAALVSLATGYGIMSIFIRK